MAAIGQVLQGFLETLKCVSKDDEENKNSNMDIAIAFWHVNVKFEIVWVKAHHGICDFLRNFSHSRKVCRDLLKKLSVWKWICQFGMHLNALNSPFSTYKYRSASDLLKRHSLSMTIWFLHHPYVDSFSFWIKSKFYIRFVRVAGQGKRAKFVLWNTNRTIESRNLCWKILKCKQLRNLIFEYNLSKHQI